MKAVAVTVTRNRALAARARLGPDGRLGLELGSPKADTDCADSDSYCGAAQAAAGRGPSGPGCAAAATPLAARVRNTPGPPASVAVSVTVVVTVARVTQAPRLGGEIYDSEESEPEHVPRCQ